MRRYCIYTFFPTADPSPWFSLFPPPFLGSPSLMDAGNTARQILGLLEGSSPEVTEELLKSVMDLIQSEPKGAPIPSLSVGGDYLRIFRHLFRSVFFPHCGSPTPPRNDGISSRARACVKNSSEGPKLPPSKSPTFEGELKPPFKLQKLKLTHYPLNK